MLTTGSLSIKISDIWGPAGGVVVKVLDSHMTGYGSSPGPGGLLSHFPSLPLFSVSRIQLENNT